MAIFQQNINQWMDILNKLSFDIQPVAFKFFATKPKGIDKLDKKLFFCEMLKAAYEGKSFYAGKENHECLPGLVMIGGVDPPPVFVSGTLGAEGQFFNKRRTCRKIYQYLPILKKGTVQYVAFSPLDKLCFEPDLLILAANVEQTAILLRAMCYGTGKKLVSQFTHVMACAWIYNQPYLTGEINYIPTGVSMGMTHKKVVPKGLQLISIPYDMFPRMLESLQNMPWKHPAVETGGDEWMYQLMTKLGLG